MNHPRHDSSVGALRHRLPPRGRSALVMAAALAQVACASIPPPEAQLAVATAAVESAAWPVAPSGAPNCATARDKLARANASMVDKYSLAQIPGPSRRGGRPPRGCQGPCATVDEGSCEVRDDNRVLREEMNREPVNSRPPRTPHEP